MHRLVTQDQCHWCPALRPAAVRDLLRLASAPAAAGRVAACLVPRAAQRALALQEVSCLCLPAAAAPAVLSSLVLALLAVLPAAVVALLFQLARVLVAVTCAWMLALVQRTVVVMCR